MPTLEAALSRLGSGGFGAVVFYGGTSADWPCFCEVAAAARGAGRAVPVVVLVDPEGSSALPPRDAFSRAPLVQPLLLFPKLVSDGTPPEDVLALLLLQPLQTLSACFAKPDVQSDCAH